MTFWEQTKLPARGPSSHNMQRVHGIPPAGGSNDTRHAGNNIANGLRPLASRCKDKKDLCRRKEEQKGLKSSPSADRPYC